MAFKVFLAWCFATLVAAPFTLGIAEARTAEDPPGREAAGEQAQPARTVGVPSGPTAPLSFRNPSAAAGARGPSYPFRGPVPTGAWFT